MHSLIFGKRGQKKFLLGNEAIARGALEAGINFFACYPGTPSSEVMDTLMSMRESLGQESRPRFHMEYSVNEKVAMEAAAGAALSGSGSMVSMKHVGLNVAADPLFTSAYIGLPGGLVVLSADDPGCHSSQNEQDNRQYARFAGLPCFEPVTPQEAHAMTKAAFEMARDLEQPVLLRTTTRVSHMRGPVILDDMSQIQRKEFKRNPGRYVPVPAVALKRHHALVENLTKAEKMAEDSVFNSLRLPQGKTSHGIIASGVARSYLADAMALAGLENDIAILELGQTWPLPKNKIEKLLNACENILVLEEGSPLLENDVRALAQRAGAKNVISGKDEGLGEFAEYSVTSVLNRVSRWLGKADIARIAPASTRNLPGRPPNLCPGCAHRTIYYAVRKTFGNDAIFSSDIGCYTLGLVPPLKTADFLVCMGSSISAGSGFAAASGMPVVGFIGDSTFFHSGMTGLANAVFNRHNILLIIMDNGTTAMTGHQPNPGVDAAILGEKATHLDIAAIVKALGVEYVEEVKAGNLAALMRQLEKLKSLSGPRVLVARETCMLFARRNLKKKKTRVAYVKKQGAETERCLRELACPAFLRKGNEIHVDENLCSGCLLCLQIAPDSFAARIIS